MTWIRRFIARITPRARTLVRLREARIARWVNRVILHSTNEEDMVAGLERALCTGGYVTAAKIVLVGPLSSPDIPNEKHPEHHRWYAAIARRLSRPFSRRVGNKQQAVTFPLAPGPTERALGVMVLEKAGHAWNTRETRWFGMIAEDIAVGIYSTRVKAAKARTEKALRASERRFRKLFDLPLAGIAMTDSDGRWIAVNDHLCALIQCTQDEIAEVSLESILQQNTNADHEGYLLRRDGTLMDVSITRSDIQEDDGRGWVVTMVTDISAQKQMERSLRESEENFRRFYNSIDHFLTVIDSDGNIVYVNDSFVNKLGFSPEEVVGKPVWSLHPASQQEQAKIIAAEMMSGKTQACNLDIMHKNGFPIPIETWVVWGQWSGKKVLLGVSKDLSELRESQDMFSKAFHSGAVLMAVSTVKDGRFFDVNETFCETLGYDRYEAIGKTSDELGLFVDTEVRDRVLSQLTGSDSRVKTTEIMVRAKNGDIHHGLFSVDPISISGHPCILTVMTDITEMRKAEQARQRSEQQFKAFMDNTPAVAAMKDETGHYLFANKACVDAFGWGDTNNWLGKTDQDLWPPEIAELNQKSDKQALAENCPQEATERIPHESNKNALWFVVRFPFVDGNNQRYVGLNALDISETERAYKRLGESEDRLRGALAAAGEGLWEFDAVTHEVYFGPQWFKMLGYAHGELPSSFATWVELLHPDERAQVLQSLEDTVAKNLDTIEMLFRMRMASGEYRWILARGKATSTNSFGRYVHFIGTNMDFTERHREQEELLALNTNLERIIASRTAELKAANEELTAFSYSVSHDLRAPVRRIEKYLQTILATNQNMTLPEREEMQHAQNECQAARDLIRDLLAMATVVISPINYEHVNLSEMAQEIFNSITRFPEPKHRTDIICHPNIIAECDRALLTVVLRNLIENACKFTSRQDHGLVTFGRITKDGRPVYYVSDNGVGFDPAHAKDIFLPFKRLDSSFMGTGIGLSTVARAISRHGGSVWATGELGKGASIFFTLAGQEVCV